MTAQQTVVDANTVTLKGLQATLKTVEKAQQTYADSINAAKIALEPLQNQIYQQTLKLQGLQGPLRAAQKAQQDHADAIAAAKIALETASGPTVRRGAESPDRTA